MVIQRLSHDNCTFLSCKVEVFCISSLVCRKLLGAL